MKLDLLQDLRSQLSMAGIERLRHSFLNPPEYEICCFNLVYDKQEERWDADFEHELTGSRESFSKTFTSELKNAITPLSSQIINSFENVQTVYKESPEYIHTLLEEILIGLQEIKNDLISNESISRYHSQVALLLLNLEGELKKRVHKNVTKSKPVKPTSFATKQIKKLSFGFRYKGDKRKESLLREVYRKCETENGRFIDEVTDEEIFIGVLTSTDLSQCHSVIHIGCETREAVYILNRLRPHFKHLTPAAIEKSRLFVTKDGTELTANNMYAAKHSYEHGTLPNSIVMIHRFFLQWEESIKNC